MGLHSGAPWPYGSEPPWVHPARHLENSESDRCSVTFRKLCRPAHSWAWGPDSRRASGGQGLGGGVQIWISDLSRVFCQPAPDSRAL